MEWGPVPAFLYFAGRDYKHSLEMQKLLKNEIGSIDVFLILLNGAETR